MIKKIKVEELRPGMFIQDLNCSWLEHPFFGSSIHCANRQMVQKVIDFGIRELYIDTDKGLDVADETPAENIITPAKERGGHTEPPLNGLVTAKKKSAGGVPINEEIFKARKIKSKTIKVIQDIMTSVKLGKHIEKGPAEETVSDIVESVFRNQDALIGLGRLRQVNDYVYQHSMSVTVLMVSFGKQLGYNPDLLREVGVGAMLHDIGTAYVPPEILNKETDLTEHEFNQIKLHVEFGRTLLEQTKDISYTAMMTMYHHHERIDGSGYPKGLKGENITPFGQAVAIVDVYDALTTKRCYKNKIQPTEALKILYEHGGTEFNLQLVEQFIRSVGIYPAGSLVRLESGLLGVVIDHNEENSLQPVVRIVYDTKKDDYIVFPYDIALSAPGNNNGGDRIVSCERPDRWNLQPAAYL